MSKFIPGEFVIIVKPIDVVAKVLKEKDIILLGGVPDTDITFSQKENLFKKTYSEDPCRAIVAYVGAAVNKSDSIVDIPQIKRGDILYVDSTRTMASKLVLIEGEVYSVIRRSNVIMIVNDAE